MPGQSARGLGSRRWITTMVAALSIAAAACSASGGASPTSVETAPSEAPSAPASAAPVASAESGGGRGDYDYETTPSDAPAASPQPATGDVIVNVASGPLGDYLTGVGDLTLYTFKPDSAETSTCDGGCAEAWPPFMVDQGAEPTGGDGVGGALTTFARADGTLQVAYDGAPLYYFANDTTPGDTNGEGLGGNWFVAKP